MTHFIVSENIRRTKASLLIADPSNNTNRSFEKWIVPCYQVRKRWTHSRRYFLITGQRSGSSVGSCEVLLVAQNFAALN